MSNKIVIGALIVVIGTILQAECASVFHYTTKAGYDGIKASNGINQSVAGARRGDARYGNGVYLTSIRPNADVNTRYVNNYDGGSLPTADKKAKVEYYFEFDSAIASTHGLHNNLPETRNIWIIPNSIDFYKLPYIKAGKSKDYRV